MENINVIVVDNHPAACYGYPLFFQGTTIAVECFTDLKSAYNVINRGRDFSVICINVSFCPTEENHLRFFARFIEAVRNKITHCKIVLLTNKTDNFSINSFVRVIDPDGFVAVSDMNKDEMAVALHRVLTGEKYLSVTIRKQVKDNLAGLNLDEISLKIIAMLAKGIRTKDLPNYIPRCISCIDKRKAYIKIVLNIEKGSGDGDIVMKARNMGII